MNAKQVFDKRFPHAGFPPDVKERELNNLLRFLPGYEVGRMDAAHVGLLILACWLGRSYCTCVTI
jgi:hypothetical protein